jgi:NADH-quinone oxidoreductase subunit F
MVRGAPRGPELLLLDDLARVMQDASICGLGQTAPAALRSALDRGLLDAPDGARNGKVPHA